jgi:hypothetical protein
MAERSLGERRLVWPAWYAEYILGKLEEGEEGT